MKFEEMINTIQLGDCYEIIKNIPDKTIDCIYTDIPYMIVNGCAGGGILKNKTRNETYKQTIGKFSNDIDYSILNEFVRVMKKTNIFIWCSKEQILDILNFFMKDKKNHYEILVWCKPNPTPFCNNTWLPDLEYCLYFREKGAIQLNNGYELKSKYYVYQKNVFDKKQYNHPTIKPLELVKRHILHTTRENDIILDCFCGSGTTCVASKETGRRYIGMEIDPKYHKIAINRLNGILANGQMSLTFEVQK